MEQPGGGCRGVEGFVIKEKLEREALGLNPSAACWWRTGALKRRNGCSQTHFLTRRLEYSPD